MPGVRCKDFGTAVLVALGLSVVNFIAFKLLIFITPRMLSTTGHLPAAEEARARDQFLKETTVKPGPARP